MFAPHANMPCGPQGNNYEGCLITLGKTWSENNLELRMRLIMGNATTFDLESQEAYLETDDDTSTKTGKKFKRELLLCSCHFSTDMIVASGTLGAWKFTANAVPLTPGQLITKRASCRTSCPAVSLAKLRNGTPLELQLYAEAEKAIEELAAAKNEIEVLHADLDYVLMEHAKAEIATQNTQQALFEAELEIEQLGMEVAILECDATSTDAELVALREDYITLRKF